MNHYKVEDIHQARELMFQFHEEGRFDGFRGQVQHWPLRSSMARLKASEREEGVKQQKRFFEWLKVQPGLEMIAASSNASLAVAQHYGLPTNFVDFSRDPCIAAFFASSTEQLPSPGVESCIFCLNNEQLHDHLDIIRIDVPNLWRLEAQRGFFVNFPFLDEAADELAEQLFACIEFPYKRVVDQPSVQQVYPARKSQLELHLDKYGGEEKLTRWGIYRRKLLPNVRSISIPSLGFDQDSFVGGQAPPVHES